MPPSLRAMISEQVAGESAERFGDQLRAIILTGSLARDEATIREEAGRRRLLGDAEFLLVFHENSKLPAASDVEETRHAIEDALGRSNVEGHVSLGTVHSKYLRKLDPHIFAYELKTCGCVVWGDLDILSIVPHSSPADIPLEDAWRLLCNRLIEQLEIVQNRDDPTETLRRSVQYPTIKLYLDMATSYLVFVGAYAPTYGERAQRLKDLTDAAPSVTDAPFPLDMFADRIGRCTAVKLTGAAPKTVLSNGEGPLDFWARSLEDAQRLWRWELQRLTGLGTDAPDRALWQRWMQQQPMKARLRGWLSALRHMDRREGKHSWSRAARRAWTASPRYWVYAAASEMCFRLPQFIHVKRSVRGADDVREFFSFLPATRQTAQIADRPDWQSLASEILWSYRRFLVETRA